MIKKKRIISLFVSITLFTSISSTVFAKRDQNLTIPNSATQRVSIDSTTYATIDVDVETNIKTIKVYTNHELTQRAVVDETTGEITLTTSTGIVTHDKISNHVKTVNTPTAPKPKESLEPSVSDNVIQTNRIMPASVSYGDGYSLIQSYYSYNYQMSACLYWKYGYSRITQQKVFSFKAGTSIAVILGVLASFITGPITITAILLAAGTLVVSRTITNDVHSSICFEYRKWHYRIRSDSGYLCLDTYQDDKWEVVYNYLNGQESYLSAGWGGGFAGIRTDMLEAGCQQYRRTFGW